MERSITKLGKGWEWQHSIWMVWLLFPLGFTAFISFFVIGAKVKEKKWIIAGFIYLVFVIQFFVVDEFFPFEHIVYDFSAMATLGMWIAAWVHAVSVRPAYLRRLAFRLYPSLHKEMSMRTGNSVIPKVAPTVKVNKYKDKRTATRRQVTASEPKVININRASQLEIASLPAFDNIIASRVINVRKRVGSFESMSHFIKEMNFQPHVIAKAKPYIIFTDEPTGSNPKKENYSHKYSTGRIVDY